MVHKVLRLVVPAGAALLVASQWADIKRYLKTKQLSARQGRPGNVPVAGRKAYPQSPGSGVADGTGDFDSASRGGPRAPDAAETGPRRHREAGRAA